MFVAMNRFKVNPGREAEFEEQWRGRDTYLGGVAGLQQFALLKGDEQGDYISQTTWTSRQAFLDWAQSDAFRKAHAAPPAEGVVDGHPRAFFYEAVLVEEGVTTARS